jgi:predicted GIY-YIG superfamily endonuclease
MAHFLYRCYDETGQLVYVGSTGDLFRRLTAHRHNSWWSYQVAKVVAKVYADPFTARAAERQAIREEQPRWNVVGRWATRHTWTAENYADYYHAVRMGSDTDSTRKHALRVRRECRLRFGVAVEAVTPA